MADDLWSVPRAGLLEYVEDFTREWLATLRDPAGRANLEMALQQAWRDGRAAGGLSCCGTASAWHRPWCSDGPRRYRSGAYEVPKPGEPQCQADGVRNGPDGPGGTEHYWTCTAPGTVDVDGELLCEDHAGERGHGPKQGEYGFG